MENKRHDYTTPLPLPSPTLASDLCGSVSLIFTNILNISEKVFFFKNWEVEYSDWQHRLWCQTDLSSKLGSTCPRSPDTLFHLRLSFFTYKTGIPTSWHLAQCLTSTKHLINVNYHHYQIFPEWCLKCIILWMDKEEGEDLRHGSCL